MTTSAWACSAALALRVGCGAASTSARADRACANGGALERDGDRWLLAAQDLVAFDADGSLSWTLPTYAGDVMRALTVLPVGGLAAAYDRPAQLSLGEWTFDRVDVLLRRLTGDGDSCGERQFGSLGDDRASTMTAWPAFGSAALVVVGATNGDLLVKKTAGDWQWDAFAIIHVD